MTLEDYAKTLQSPYKEPMKKKSWFPKNMGLGFGAGAVITAFLFREIIPDFSLTNGLIIIMGGFVCFSIGCLGSE